MHNLSLWIRSALSFIILTGTGLLVIALWQQYVLAPWTRDGRVSADIVRIAPEVSGTVLSVSAADNEYVRRGDILYAIDPKRFELAIASAQADLEAKRQDMLVRQSTAQRRNRLRDVVSQEDVQQTAGAAAQASAAYQGAQAALDLAKLNLARATIRSPVDGYVANLRLRPGDYATAGETKIAVVDASSFRITGYFEETKLRRIGIGSPAQIMLMGFDNPLSGHVESIGRGIEDSNDAPGQSGLPSVEAAFTWVRLAQRIPVRIHIDRVPSSIELTAGMTASVAVGPAIASDAPRGRLISLLRAVE